MSELAILIKLILGLFLTVGVFTVAKVVIDPKASLSVRGWHLDNVRSIIIVFSAGLKATVVWVIIGSWL